MHQATCHETWMKWNGCYERQDTIQLTRENFACVARVKEIAGLQGLLPVSETLKTNYECFAKMTDGPLTFEAVHHVE